MLCFLDIVEECRRAKHWIYCSQSTLKILTQKIKGTNNYEDTKDSDVVVITSYPKKAGMSRDDLIATNTKIVKEVTENVAKHSPNSVIIVVTKPA